MILKFHVKFCSTFAENSTGQLETEVRLARFNNVHIITATEDEKYPYRALFSRPYLRNGERPNYRYATLLPFPTPVTTGGRVLFLGASRGGLRFILATAAVPLQQFAALVAGLPAATMAPPRIYLIT